jgi:uncharacterized RDD family membrane protein YckC
MAIPGVIVSILIIGAAAFTAAGGGGGGPPGAIGPAEQIASGAAQFLVVLIQLAYFTLMHGTSGRSVGKMAGNLKVVMLDLRPITMRTAFVRALAYVGPSLLPAAVMFVSPLASQIVGILPGIYVLVDAIVAFTDKDMQRSVHDRIAGTRVILTKV